MTPTQHRQLAAVIVVVALLVGVVVMRLDSGAGPEVAAETPSTGPQIIVGEVDGEPAPIVEPVPNGPGVAVADDGVTLSPRAEPAADRRVLPPDGGPPGSPVPFHSDSEGHRDLVFVLVAGSDARPGEDVTRTRADSVHVVAVNPGLGAGTIVGIPRDAWVDIPGHGKGKINSALALGGPQLLARTVTEATGIPLRWYVLTGFAGLEAMTDDLGGVNVHLDRRMNDPNSGAHFERGWHHFKGNEALAFSRNRKDTALGDFSRSENHGILMLATLAKMRAEIGDEGGLGRWLEALRRHVHLDMGMGELFDLAVTARRLDPARVANVVASGKVGKAGSQSVVFLDDGARATFADVADDGVLRDPPPPYDPPGTRSAPATTTTTTTTAPVAFPATSTTTSTTTTTAPGSSGSSSTTTTTTTTTIFDLDDDG